MAQLSYKKRKALPKGAFALPPKKGDKSSKGRYPIHDLAHARNALARVAQHGTKSEQVRVRSAVYKKFPGLKKRAMARKKKK